jgi:hypothetical protein
MATLTLKGRVEADGRLVIDEKVDLPPGEITLMVQPRVQIQSISLEEAKRELANPRELTGEEWAETARIYDEMARLADLAGDLGLPADYGDELDHYLYGTLKRSELVG